MGRFKATSEGNVPFTSEEEAEWDAMEAEWEVNEPQRLREAMTVTNKQLRLAMNQSGVLTNATSAVSSAVDPVEMGIHWNYSNTVNRTDPWVIEIGTAIGMSDSALDSLFSSALEI